LIFVSHRGNLTGPDPNKENRPSQIDLCIEAGFDVEIDLRVRSGRLFLGHDEAQYETTMDWLLERKDRLWVHCKDVDALEEVLSSDLNYFWHDKDDHTITSKGHVWSYPGVILCSRSIAVMPELWMKKEQTIECAGVCSDFILQRFNPRTL